MTTAYISHAACLLHETGTHHPESPQRLYAIEDALIASGLMDLLDIARLSDTYPANRALIGIQPQLMDWGMQPTQAVHRALPIAVNEAVKLIETWNDEQLDTHATESKQSCNKTSAKSPETGA